MTRIYRSILVAILILAVPYVTHAASLRCKGKIIEPGHTEHELLDACGHPTSYDGDNLLYEKRGSQPVVVTVSRGVVTFVRSKHESGAFRHPFGDRP